MVRSIRTIAGRCGCALVWNWMWSNQAFIRVTRASPYRRGRKRRPVRQLCRSNECGEGYRPDDGDEMFARSELEVRAKARDLRGQIGADAQSLRIPDRRVGG